MKRNLLTILVTLAAILSPHLARCETAVEAWARRYSTRVGSSDEAYHVTTDAVGNVFVAGTSDDRVTGADLLTIKYSGAGVAMWTNRYNGPGNGDDYPAGVAVDGSGNAIVTAWSAGSQEYNEIVTIKYSSAGAPLWTNRYSGPGNGQAYPGGIAADASGNVYMAGRSEGIGTSADYVTIKYSSAGVPLWTNRYNGPGNGDDYVYAMTVDASGNVFVTGTSASATSDDCATVSYSGAGALLWVNRYHASGDSAAGNAVAVAGTNVYVTGYSYSPGQNDNFVTLAYSTAGTGLWTNHYDGESSYDEAYAVVASGTNVFVTGASYTSSSANDFLTIAYSNFGTPLWTNRYNTAGASSEEPRAIAMDGSGNIFVTGYSYGAISSDYLTIAYSSTGMILWINRYNGPANSAAEPYAVATDGSGNVFVTGYAVSDSRDFATIKYSSLGVGLWTNRYGGLASGNAYSQAVAVQGGSNIVVTGYSLGLGTGTDYATIKYSSTGVPLWTNRYSGPANDDYAEAVAVDGSGNVIVTGYSADNVNNDDYATIKYSSAGVPLWTNRYSGPGGGADRAYAVAVDASGNVFVAGYSFGSSDDFATIKYSSAGVAIWTNRYDRDGSDDEPLALAVDASGSVIVTGYSYDNATGYDFVTIKYSNAGVPLWTNRYNGPVDGEDRAQALAVDGSGNVVVTGYSEGGSSALDYLTIKYSSAGVALWTNRCDASAGYEDAAQAVAVDASDNIFVTGFSYSSVSDKDYTTVAYSSAGLPLWTNLYNGPGNSEDQAMAVAVDGSGRVFVTGYSEGNASQNDIATVAYSTAGAGLWTNRYNSIFNREARVETSRCIAAAGNGSVVVAGWTIFGGHSDFATVKYVTVPQLAITRPSNTIAKITWPFPSTDFRLQQNTNLNTTNWISPPETVGNDGTNKFITVSPPTGNRFYRLIYP